jgi:hypothetical protein
VDHLITRLKHTEPKEALALMQSALKQMEGRLIEAHINLVMDPSPANKQNVAEITTRLARLEEENGRFVSALDKAKPAT